MAEQILNVRLYDNPLTPELNDFSGRVVFCRILTYNLLNTYEISF